VQSTAASATAIATATGMQDVRGRVAPDAPITGHHRTSTTATHATVVAVQRPPAVVVPTTPSTAATATSVQRRPIYQRADKQTERLVAYNIILLKIKQLPIQF